MQVATWYNSSNASGYWQSVIFKKKIRAIVSTCMLLIIHAGIKVHLPHEKTVGMLLNWILNKRCTNNILNEVVFH